MSRDIPIGILSDKGQAFFFDVMAQMKDGKWPRTPGPELDAMLYALRDKHGPSAYREFMRYVTVDNGGVVEEKYKAQ